MSTDINNQSAFDDAFARWPRWAIYFAVVLAVVILTAFLKWMAPVFPLGEFPIAYIILLAVISYYLSIGPTILALLLSLAAFDYYFIHPTNMFWPIADSARGWAGFSAYFLGISIVTLAMVLIRRSQRRIRTLVTVLQENEERLARIVATSPNGIMVLDTDSNIAFSNDAALSILGVTREEILSCKYDYSSLNITDIAGGPIAKDQLPFARVIKAGEKVSGAEHKIRRSDGEYVALSVNAAAMRDVAGKVMGVVAVLNDITKNVELQQAMDCQFNLLQRALAPRISSICQGYRAAAKYVSSRVGENIGGDFYDVFETEDGCVAITIGDVVGKGIEAASLASATRSTVRAFAYEMSQPGIALAHANSVLCSQSYNPEKFVTVFLIIMDPATGKFAYSSAGHPPPAVYRAGGEVELLELGNLPVCLINGYDFSIGESVLELGDKIILYTDGIMEARKDHKLFDLAGIKNALCQHGYKSADELVECLIAEAKQWAGGDFDDDAAVVVVERLAPLDQA